MTTGFSRPARIVPEADVRVVAGLPGYVVPVAAFFAKFRHLKRDPSISVRPYALTLIVALSPLAGPSRFYRFLSAGVIWWMMTIVSSAFAVSSRKGMITASGE